MNVWYIKEMEKNEDILTEKQKKFPKIFKTIICKFKKIFNKIKIEEIDDKIICTLPNSKKIEQKLMKKLYKYNAKNIVLSDYLNSIEGLSEIKNNQKLNILNGRKIFNYMIIDVMKYIVEKQGQELEKQEVSILINNKTDISLKNILLICSQVKSVNIVTEKNEQFKEIEEYIYENIGMMIKISNNIKKAMGKSNIIINLDFTKEMINRYIIPRNSIIININGRIEELKKQFNGINVQYFEPTIPKKYEEDLKKYGVWNLFSKASLCESVINLRDNFENIREKLTKEEIVVDRLIGVKGELQESEWTVKSKIIQST